MKNRKIISIILLIVIVVGCGKIDLKVFGKEKWKNNIKKYVAISEKKSSKNIFKDCTTNYEVIQEEDVCIYSFEDDEKTARKIGDTEGIIVSENINVTACWEKKKKHKIRHNMKEWNMQLINQKENHENKNKIKVAILDSGIDFTEDINVKKYVNFIPGEEKEFNLFQDTTGHGTSIAGIIVAGDNDIGISGMTENVELYSARILDDNNNAPISRVVQGIYWAIDNNVKIINLSFGTPENSPVLYQAIKDAYEEGILIVAAAGNTGEQVQYPAAYNEVMAVGAVDSFGKISDFSAKDEQIDIMAPGENVKSTGAFDGEIIVSGTSISAPHVVGMAALLWVKDKSVSADFIRGLIIDSANYINQTNSYKGIIDVDYAFKTYDKYKEKFYQNKGSLMTKYMEDDNIHSIDKNNIHNENKLNTNKNDYVSGTWSYAGHTTIAGYAGNLCDLTTTQTKIVKLGIKYPDQKFSTMTNNPQWHTGVFATRGYFDYISYYTCATKIAKALRKGKKINSTNIAKTAGMSDTFYSKMLSQVNKIKWSEVLGGASVTNYNKGLFATGMAMHIITDAYAHQAYMKTGDKWVHLTHKDSDDTCDNYQYSKYKNRFKDAKNAGYDTLSDYTMGYTSDWFNFLQDYKDYKLKGLKQYVLEQKAKQEDLEGYMYCINKGNID